MKETKKLTTIRRTAIVNACIGNGEYSFTDSVLAITETEFGDMIQPDVPEYANGVVLCLLKPGGLHTVGIRLLHQIYTERLDDLLLQNPTARGIVLIPINNKDYIEIVKK